MKAEDEIKVAYTVDNAHTLFEYAAEAIALLRDCPIKYFDFSGYEGEGAEWLRKREAYLEGGETKLERMGER